MEGELFGLISTEETPVPLAGVKVDGTITGRAARIRVSQRFINHEKQSIEAVYKFPLPEAAAVCGFTIRVGKKTIQGAVEERDEAFEKYDEALAKGNGAFLLDEERPNIFTLSVGNLKPETEAVIEIEYVSLLDVDGRQIEFLLPTTIAPRYLPAGMADEKGMAVSDIVNPVYALQVPYGISINLEVCHRESLESIESPSHPIKVGFDGESARVAFGVESVRMDRDFLLVMRRKKELPSQAYLWKSDGRKFMQVDFTLTAEAARKEAAGSTAGTELVFVLDCSGSMGGSSIAEAKKALEICLKALETGTCFNIYRFGSTFERLFDRAREYDQESLAVALEYVRGTEANLGGTEIMGPLEDICGAPAAEGRERLVVVITDGQVGNEDGVMELIRKQAGRTRFSVIGIGYGPNEFLLKGLARAGRGLTATVHPGERIEPKVLSLFGKFFSDSLEDVSIADGPAEGAQAPRNQVIFTGETVSIFAALEGAPEKAAAVTIRGKLNGKTMEWQVPAAEVKTEAAAIPVLWARERIRELEENGEWLAGSRQEGRKKRTISQEIVALSREYGLLSRSTSYIGIEERKSAEKETGEMKLRKVPVMLTAGWHGIETADTVNAGVTSNFYFAPRMMKVVSLPCKCPCPSPIPQDKDNPLVVKILALQRQEGGLDFDEEVARELRIEKDELLAAAGRADEPETAFRLLWTAVVMELLEHDFRKEKQIWSFPLAKSRKWLKNAAAQTTWLIEGKKPLEWAEAYADGRKKQPKA